MLYYSEGSTQTALSDEDIKNAIEEVFSRVGKKERLLIIPPDHTRLHSYAGKITQIIYRNYSDKVKDILPALGTHSPMNEDELKMMFGAIPLDLFRIHDWRNDLETLGIVPETFINEVSEGKLNYNWPAQVNKLLKNGNHDLIVSIGQVVPHEVVGMANHAKNIFVGTGGKEGINKSHFLGAVYGMERMMGKTDTPVRRVLNYASSKFAKNLPILYILTVVGKDTEGNLKVRGLYIGDDEQCFNHAASLSQKVNFEILEKPLRKVICYLDPLEFKSTWLGNKSIYRTRMAIADEGELIVLAPGLKEFGEDKEIDRLIRKYGYKGTNATLEATLNHQELKDNLSAAAHLIHGTSDGRFNISYCPGHLNREEIESVGYQYADLKKMQEKYKFSQLKDGFNVVNGEDIFYISNPALGLWAFKEKFTNSM